MESVHSQEKNAFFKFVGVPMTENIDDKHMLQEIGFSEINLRNLMGRKGFKVHDVKFDS